MKEENLQLDTQLVSIKDINRSNEEIKDLYEKRLLNYKDSFGRIYEIAPTEQDIDTDKSTVKVRPVSAEQTVLSMDSVAGSVVNNDFLDRADLDPKNALAQDNPTADSAKVYDNLFAATEANAEKEDLKKVASFYYDDKVQEAEKKETKGTAVPTRVDQQELKDLLARYSTDLKEQSK